MLALGPRPFAVALLAVAMTVALGAGSAAAQDKPDYKAAAQHYRSAEEAMEKKDYATAASEYQIAFDITKDPVLYFKIGQAHDRNGNCQLAVSFYEKYLAEAKPEESFRTKTDDLITACKERMAITETETETGTGTGTGTGAGTETGTETGTGTTKPDLEKPPEGSTETPPAMTDDSITWAKTAAWTSVGIAIALATTGAVFALSARSREEDIDNLIEFRDAQDQPARFTGATQERYDDLIAEGERMQALSIVAFAATGVAAGAAVLFFVLDAKNGEATEEREPALTPVVGPGSVGATYGWRF